MSEKIKVGDRATSVVSGQEYEILAVHGNLAWIKPLGAVSDVEVAPFNFLKLDLLKKITPFFEVGKIYTCAGDVFEPTVVEKNSDGSLIAFGKLADGRGRHWHMWVSKRQDLFHAWHEQS